jgi:hypothetical protein
LNRIVIVLGFSIIAHSSVFSVEVICNRYLVHYALAYNLDNFVRSLATPEPIQEWSLTSLREKLIKIDARIVSHGRYVAFQMAEVAIPRNPFGDILRMIADLRPPPVTLTA